MLNIAEERYRPRRIASNDPSRTLDKFAGSTNVCQIRSVVPLHERFPATTPRLDLIPPLQDILSDQSAPIFHPPLLLEQIPTGISGKSSKKKHPVFVKNLPGTCAHSSNMPEVFAVPVFFIVFRETLETTIVVSVLLSFLKQQLGPDRDRTVYKKLRNQVRWCWVSSTSSLTKPIATGMVWRPHWLCDLPDHRMRYDWGLLRHWHR